MEFYLPTTTGEWLAWSVAVVTAVFGLLLLFAPGLMLKVLRLQPVNERPEAIAAVRANLAGFHLGLGLGCLIFAQPFLWLVLGVAWGFTLFGRLISILSDKGSTLQNWLAAIVEFLLAAGPLLYAFGFVS
ncbi:DUF4345 domain-containing protein [Daeguia caeni]|uniref:DUF4345 domain-containing protein n=1 Tax=Daeguia caeni TaxID=439612 RepID=A0ABV9GZZ1_9HYPH